MGYYTSIVFKFSSLERECEVTAFLNKFFTDESIISDPREISPVKEGDYLVVGLFKNFPSTEFIDYVQCYEWSDPESVQLLIMEGEDVKFKSWELHASEWEGISLEDYYKKNYINLQMLFRLINKTDQSLAQNKFLFQEIYFAPKIDLFY